MNLKETILAEHSKAQKDTIVAWVGSSQYRFNQLMALVFTDENKVAQRASWPLSDCVMKHPALINKQLGKLLQHLQQPNLHDAVKRHTVRILQEIQIPEVYQGAVMDVCFSYVESPTETVAVKAFSLTILGKLAKQYPEIIPEIELLVQDQLPRQTAAFHSRARVLLKQFAKR